MTPATKEWLAALVAGGATYLTILWLARKTEERDNPSPSVPGQVPGVPSRQKPGAPPGWPADPNAPPAPSPSGPPAEPSASPVKLGDPLTLQPGKKYRVALKLEGLTKAMASQARILEEGRTMGFTDVWASATRPDDWPSKTEADWFISGTYKRLVPLTQPRPAEVVEAWEG